MSITKLKVTMWVILSLSVSFLFCFSHISYASNKATVALVMKSLSNPFFTKMEASAIQYANGQKIPLEVFGVNRETDIERQIEIVESLISRGYGAIVLSPSDSKKLIPACKKALEKGIAVINIDDPLDPESLKKLGLSIPFIGSDNFAGGYMVGNYLAHQLKKNSRVMVIEGIRGTANAEQRKAGFMQAINDKGSIKIVSTESANWHMDEAFSLVTELLEKHGRVDAIFCANDTMAVGAMQAVELKGLSDDIIIAGYDNIDSVRTEIRGGRIHATIEQHPEDMGAIGVKFANAVMNNEEVVSHYSIPLDLITYETFGKNVVFSISTLDNSFFVMMARAAREEANLMGIELTILDADNQDTRQLADIAGSLSTNIDLLIVNPANTDSIYPGIELANNRAIPVITIDRKASAGEISCHIASNNTEGGRLAARFLAEKLHQGDLLELEGIPGTSAAYERGAGFNEELKKYSLITVTHREVANFNRDEARIITEQLLDEGKTFSAVFAHNDSMILGLIDAFEESAIPLPKILVGFDAIPEARELIQQKKLTATIAQQPDVMGKLAVETAARIFRREKIPSEILVELSLVTN